MAGLKVDVTAIPTPGTGTPAGFKVDVTSLPVGFQGLQGEKGDKGDQGEPGASGSLAGLNGHNSFTYVWKDNATITIKANGQATSADGAYTYTLSADTDLSLPGGLDAGSEAANTKYYIWAGLAGGVLTFKFSLSGTTPIGLTNPIRLPGCISNNASSNIIPFHIEGDCLYYNAAIPLLAASVSIYPSYMDCPMGLYVPMGSRRCVGTVTTATSAMNIHFRKKGVASGDVQVMAPAAGFPTLWWAIINTDGIVELAVDASQTIYLSLYGVEL